MFKSIGHGRFDYKTERYVYDLEDSEFGKIEIVADDLIAGKSVESEIAIIIAKEYSKRNLNVAKNIALYILSVANRYGCAAKQVCEWQDAFCSQYFPNWKDVSKSRDEWLQKLLLIQ